MITELKNRYLGETVWIVGKGPSIAYLRAEHFGPGPVIALNEAIIKVEQLGLANPVYSMQKDGVEANTVRPKSAILLVHKHESQHIFMDYSPRYVFDNIEDFGLMWNSPSAMSATSLAKFMGCARVVFVCCDAAHGDARLATPMPDGSIEISGMDYGYGAICTWAYGLAQRINMPVEWVRPGGE